MYHGFLYLDQGTKAPSIISYPVSWSNGSSAPSEGVLWGFVIDFLIEGGLEFIFEVVFGLLG